MVAKTIEKNNIISHYPNMYCKKQQKIHRDFKSQPKSPNRRIAPEGHLFEDMITIPIKLTRLLRKVL